MTVTIGAPNVISVTATAENQYTVTSTAQSGITATVSIPNKGDKGDKGDPGEPTPSGIDKTIQYNNAGTLDGDQLLKWDNVTKTLRVGVEGDTPLPNNPASFRGSIDSYLQVTVQNDSAGNEASSDFVATADNGDDESYYIDVGTNSSTYSLVDDITEANDSYVWANGGDLFLVADTTGSAVKVVSGGGASADLVATFDATGLTMATGKAIAQRPEVYYGTGSPPSATGLADGTLFFKYEV